MTSNMTNIENTQTTDQTDRTVTAGDLVRVVTVSPDASPEFKEYALGQVATYVQRVETLGAPVHRVRFTRELDGSNDWNVRDVVPLTADDARVGDYRFPFGDTNPATWCHRMSPHSSMFCSRTAGHTGPHVAAEGHTGEVIEVWPSDKPADAPAQPAQPERYDLTANGSPIVPRGTRIIIREVYPGRTDAERRLLPGRVVVTEADKPDYQGDLRVVPAPDAPWPNDPQVYNFSYARRWELADQPDAGSLTSEPATVDMDDEATAKRDYTALANGAVRLAAEQDWCSEFENVMTAGGFAEVACTRQRTWSLRLGFEYDLDDEEMAAAIVHTFGGATPIVTNSRTTVPVEADITWTGADPDQIETSDLCDLLNDAGYDDYDRGSVYLVDSEDTDDADTIGITPTLGDHDTWVARLDAFTTLIHAEAHDRGWGHYLADVYTSAGLDRPVAKTLHVTVSATRNVYRYEDSPYGKALAADGDVDTLVLHKRIEFTIPNPHTDTTCRCDEREDGNRLPGAVRQPVIDGARTKLREMFGDTHAGWTAKHDDVTISCMYCN